MRNKLLVIWLLGWSLITKIDTVIYAFAGGFTQSDLTTNSILVTNLFILTFVGYLLYEKKPTSNVA